LRRTGSRQAFRCRECRQRFFASPASETLARFVTQSARKHHHHKHMEAGKKTRMVRRIIMISVYLLMFSAFGLLLHYLSVDHVRPSNEPDPTVTSE
jgi:hypothetical protein